MIEMVFGYDAYSHNIHIEGRSMDECIKRFMIEVLEPEKYVQPKFIKFPKLIDEETGDEYDDEEHPVFSDKAVINGFISVKNEYAFKRKSVVKLALKDCQNFDLKPYSRAIAALPALAELEEKNESTTEIIPCQQELERKSKLELRRMVTDIEARKEKLELAKQELEGTMDVLRNEVNRKSKILFAIGTFLGEGREIYQLLEGQNAPGEEPLHIYQQTLYMDEEVGIWEDEGIDFEKLEVFDEWIKKNYDKFVYKPKGLVVFQIRRNLKESSKQNPWAMLNDAHYDLRSYLLIRNGTNLYRVYTNLDVGPRLIPRLDEFEVKEGKTSWQKDEMKSNYERYIMNYISLQSLIDNTEVFGNNVKGKVNLISGKFENMVVLIRDDEPSMKLSDGKLNWYDYLKENRKGIGLGTRIVLSKHIPTFENEETYRFGGFRPQHSPSMDAIYIVEEDIKKEKSWDYSFIIRYNPKDEIWYPYDYKGVHERKRRIPVFLYSDEVLNFDSITLEDVEYYMTNRIYRNEYLSLMRVLHFVRKQKRKERELEDNFIRFMLGKLNLADNKENFDKFRELARWWKLKNKWKRELTADDAKAVRMIERRYKRLVKT